MQLVIEKMKHVLKIMMVENSTVIETNSKYQICAIKSQQVFTLKTLPAGSCKALW